MAALATTATALVVTVGVAATGSQDAVEASSAERSAASIGTIDLDRMVESREQRVSRTADRITLQPQPIAHMFATEPLNVWQKPGEKGKKLTVVKWSGKVALTGQMVGDWSEIVVKKGVVGWLNNQYLVDDKPQPAPEPEPEPAAEASAEAAPAPAAGGISSAACSHGSGPESGLTYDAVEVYRAVCALFPGVSAYGGYSPRGEHYDGRAIDIMVSGSYGQQIADWLVANAGSLQVRDVIYSQRIWTPERAGEGWRYMEDRGSTTANHYDHVHVAVY
jgi:hypothetical protein